jgi:hypothetical protein
MKVQLCSSGLWLKEEEEEAFGSFIFLSKLHHLLVP